MHRTTHLARSLSIGAIVAALASIDGRAAAQCRPYWAQAHLGSQSGHVMVYDSARSRVLLHCPLVSAGSATGTWSWNGTAWTRAAFEGPLPARTNFAMAYDSDRDRILLFGGLGANSSLLGDTWEFDGLHWRPVATDGPSPRQNASMAYNSQRGTVMLFGGAAPGASPQTWEWDGVRWTQLAVSGPAASTAMLPMVYDSVRERLVLLSSGTWFFADGAWSQYSAQEPPWQSARAMAYDPGRHRVVVFGGGPGCTAFDPGETWEFNEVTWVQRDVLCPPARSLGAIAYDQARQITVLFGGKTSGLPGCGPALDFADTWEWNGNSWTHKLDRPMAREYSAAVYHAARGKTLLFGGLNTICGSSECTDYLNDTWEWNAAGWTTVSLPTSPPERTQHAIAYDSVRGRAVLFGGIGDSGLFADTWNYTGTWSMVSSTGPGGRGEHALAYDPGRDRVVLFGGVGPGPAPTTTWEWNPATSTWANVTPDGPSPAPRSGGAMAYDPVRAKVILFAGASLITGLQINDTWEWSGTQWTQLNVTAPPERQGHAMATDPARSVIVMTGGGTSTVARDDTWEWNGNFWTQKGSGGPLNAGQTMAYDSARGAMFMRSRDASWQWVQPSAPAIVLDLTSQTGTQGGSAHFDVVATGTGPLSYTWYLDGIVRQNDGRIHGATTAHLVIEDLMQSDAGHYDVTVSSACGQVLASTVLLTVYCTADYNQDGFVDGIDYDNFNNDFEAGNPAADINGDGFIDGIDYDTFMNAFETGC